MKMSALLFAFIALGTYEAEALKCYNCQEFCGDMQRELIECEPGHNFCSYDEGVIVTITPPGFELMTRFVHSNTRPTQSQPWIIPSNLCQTADPVWLGSSRSTSWSGVIDVIDKRNGFHNPLELFTGRQGSCTGDGCSWVANNSDTQCYSSWCFGFGCQLYSATSVVNCGANQTVCVSTTYKTFGGVEAGSYNNTGETTSEISYQTEYRCGSLELLNYQRYNLTENSCETQTSEGRSTTVCTCLASSKPCVPFGTKLVEGIHPVLGRLKS